jgi:Ni2+-binding GTPase involved in maturation of urease and hydrogenase
MRLITISGPPSSGKTSILLKAIDRLKERNYKIGVVKFDCLSTDDDKLYKKRGVLVQKGLSGSICPDHYFVSNIEECVDWGEKNKLDFLITESAGLCNRCSPYIKNILAICVIDNLSGINTPKKIGPMLKGADMVVVTKGDIVSQAEREVFAHNVRLVNPKAMVMHINGITGQGANELANIFEEADELVNISGEKLRFPMPSAVCSYCLGETKIGEEFQNGNIKKMDFGGKNEN